MRSSGLMLCLCGGLCLPATARAQDVRVQAAISLGELPSSVASSALARVLQGKGGFALRREPPWFISDRDGRVIAAGVQAWADTVNQRRPSFLHFFFDHNY